MISGVVVCLHVTGVLEVCLPVFVDGVMSNGKALRYISYTGAPAKKFPGLFSLIFLFVLLVYRAQTCPVGTDRNGKLYPMRGDSPPPPPPPPFGCPIPHPTTYRRWGEISESVVRWGLRFFHFLERNGMTE